MKKTLIFAMFLSMFVHAIQAENPIRLYHSPSVYFPHGYVVVSKPEEGAPILKLVSGAASLRVEAKLRKEERTYYISNWGWEEVVKRGETPTWIRPLSQSLPTVEIRPVESDDEDALKGEFPSGLLRLTGAGPEADVAEVVREPGRVAIVARIEKGGREYLVTAADWQRFEDTAALQTVVPFDPRFQDPLAGVEKLKEVAGEKEWMVDRLVSLDTEYPDDSYEPFSHFLMHDVTAGGLDFQEEVGLSSAREVLARLELVEAVSGREYVKEHFRKAERYLETVSLFFDWIPGPETLPIEILAFDRLRGSLYSRNPLLYSVYREAAESYVGGKIYFDPFDINMARIDEDWAAGMRVQLRFGLIERISSLDEADRLAVSEILSDAASECLAIETATDGLFAQDVDEEKLQNYRNILLTDRRRDISLQVAAIRAAIADGLTAEFQTGIAKLVEEADGEFEQALSGHSDSRFPWLAHDALLLSVAEVHRNAAPSLTLPRSFKGGIAEVHSGIRARKEAVKQTSSMSQSGASASRVKGEEFLIDPFLMRERGRNLLQQDLRIEFFRVPGIAGVQEDELEARYACVIVRKDRVPVFHSLVSAKDLDVYSELMFGNYEKRNLSEIEGMSNVEDEWYAEAHRRIYETLFAPLLGEIADSSTVEIRAEGKLLELPLAEIFEVHRPGNVVSESEL